MSGKDVIVSKSAPKYAVFAATEADTISGSDKTIYDLTTERNISSGDITMEGDSAAFTLTQGHYMVTYNGSSVGIEAGADYLEYVIIVTGGTTDQNYISSISTATSESESPGRLFSGTNYIEITSPTGIVKWLGNSGNVAQNQIISNFRITIEKL